MSKTLREATADLTTACLAAREADGRVNKVLKFLALTDGPRRERKEAEMSEQGVTLSRETVEALRHFTEAIFAGTDYPSGKHIHARVLLEALQADLYCAEQSTTEEPAGAPNRRRRERLVVTAPRQVKARLAQAASETAATPDRQPVLNEADAECPLADAMFAQAQRNPDLGVPISAQTLREWSRQVRGLTAARDRLARRNDRLEQQITLESEAGCDE